MENVNVTVSSCLPWTQKSLIAKLFIASRKTFLRGNQLLLSLYYLHHVLDGVFYTIYLVKSGELYVQDPKYSDLLYDENH